MLDRHFLGRPVKIGVGTNRADIFSKDWHNNSR